MKLAKALSGRIRALREAAGLSQQEVATRGDLSLSLVAKLEQGKKADPRASTLLALAAALGVPPGLLLDGLYPAPGGRDEAEPAGASGEAVEANGDPAVAPVKPGKKKHKGGKKKK